jgi:hypothetical protein
VCGLCIQMNCLYTYWKDVHVITWPFWMCVITYQTTFRMKSNFTFNMMILYTFSTRPMTTLSSIWNLFYFTNLCTISYNSINLPQG